MRLEDVYMPFGDETVWGGAWQYYIVQVCDEEGCCFLTPEGKRQRDPCLMGKKVAEDCEVIYRDEMDNHGLHLKVLPAIIRVGYTVAERQRDHFQLESYNKLIRILKEALEIPRDK